MRRLAARKAGAATQAKEVQRLSLLVESGCSAFDHLKERFSTIPIFFQTDLSRQFVIEVNAVG